MLTPIASPIAARQKETSRFAGSSPERIIANIVTITDEGAANVRSGIRPVREPNSQSSSSATGEIQREAVRRSSRRPDVVVAMAESPCARVRCNEAA